MTLRHRDIVAALALAIAVTMGTAVANGFVYDDVSAIVENAHVTSPHWASIPASTYWLGTLWRPFTVAGFAAEWAAFGGHAWGFHLVSLLAYLAVAVLLFLLLERLGTRRTVAAVLSILFVVHPVHVEVVANVVGQSELWVALALLAATLIYLRAPPPQRHGMHAAALLVVVALGVMSKEQGFVAPLLLLGVLWLRLPVPRPRTREQIRLLWIVAAVTVILLLIRRNITGSLGGETSATAFTGTGFGARALTFLDVVPRDAMLLIWPMHLQADYNPPQIPIGGPVGALHVIGLALVVAIIALFWWSRHRAPLVAFGCWWTAITLAPVTNLVTATGIVMAERVLFLPSIGVAIAIAGGVTVWQRHARPVMVVRWVVAAAAAWGVVMGVRSFQRTAVWHDNSGFFTRLTIDAPTSSRAWKVAATYWSGAHQNARAEADFRHSIALWPRDPDAYEQLGQLLRTEGRYADAVPVLTAGVQLDPERTTLRAKLIECLIKQRRWDAAMRVATDGVRIGQQSFGREEQRIVNLRIHHDN
jgi:hypothetical protein